jgi:hypothetical protein
MDGDSQTYNIKKQEHKPLFIKFPDWVFKKKTTLEDLFPELANIYLSQDMKSVSELHGQML